MIIEGAEKSCKKNLNFFPNPITFPSGGGFLMMKNYNTFAETEALLQTAIEFPGNSIKDIAAATGIKPNTLYKWKSSVTTHLSP